jgi:hypothetical protein
LLTKRQLNDSSKLLHPPVESARSKPPFDAATVTSDALNCSIGLASNVHRSGLFASRSRTPGVALPANFPLLPCKSQRATTTFFRAGIFDAFIYLSINRSTDFIAVERGHVNASKTEPLSCLIVRSGQHATVVNVDID